MSTIPHSPTSAQPPESNAPEDVRFVWVQSLTVESKAHLQALSRSAYAASLGDEFDLLEEPTTRHASATRAQSHRRKLLDEIGEQIDAIESMNGASGETEWAALTLAKAVAVSARGRAYLALGHRTRALRDFDQAILLLPDYIDPYLRRAEIHLSDLPTSCKRAEADLLRALVLSPSDQRAHFLLGKLLATAAVARIDEAKSHLLRADLIPESYLALSEIYHRHDRRLDKAIAALQLSLAMDPRPDVRAVRFIDCVMKFTADLPARVAADRSRSMEGVAAEPVASAGAAPAADPSHGSPPPTRQNEDEPRYQTVEEQRELLNAAFQFATSIAKLGRKEDFRALGRSKRDKLQERIAQLRASKPMGVLEKDSRTGLNTQEKNAELSAKLSTAPWLDRQIVRIDRNDVASGWYIT